MTQLPHTRTRTVHWLGTAAALAAVLGATALLQPHDATATPGTHRAAGAPDPAKAHYPLDCGDATGGTDVLGKGAADFDADGLTETVAVVSCKAEGGTPPGAVFVLAHPAHEGERPRIVATLVPQKERMSVKDLRVAGRTISATLLGYSSPDVPRCCPDKQRKVKWEWKNGKFTLVPAPVAGSAAV